MVTTPGTPGGGFKRPLPGFGGGDVMPAPPRPPMPAPPDGGDVMKAPTRPPMPVPQGGGEVMKMPPRPGMPSAPPPMAPRSPVPMPGAPPGGNTPGREYWDPSADERAGFLKNNPGDEGRIKEAFSRPTGAGAAPPSAPLATPAAAARPAAPPPVRAAPAAPSMQALAPGGAGGGALSGPPDTGSPVTLAAGMAPQQVTPENPVAMQSAVRVNLNPNLGRRILPASMRALAQAGSPLY